MVFLANLTKAHCFDKLYLMAAVKKQPPPHSIKAYLFFISFLFDTSCSYSAHLPGAWQSITTGPGKAVMGTASFAAPAGISGCRPHCVIPRSRGAVTGRKYHHRLPRSWRDGPATGHFQNRKNRSAPSIWSD